MTVLSAPSKTFLVGEYSVVRGGPCLLLSTGPRFEMQAQLRESHTSPFHTQSPAGRYFVEHRSMLSPWSVKFTDPHQEKGGFGASSAQLLMLMALKEQLQGSGFAATHGPSFYRAFADLSRRSGSSASGADFMAQLAGGLVYFQPEPFILESQKWPLPDLDLILIRTGFKLATHLHLERLADYSIEVPTALVKEAQSALERKYQRDLVQSVREYRHWLKAQGFEADRTSDLIAEIEYSGLALTSKGCGAMGADVVLILSPIENRQRLLNWAHDRHLQVVATRDDLSQGLQVIVEE